MELLEGKQGTLVRLAICAGAAFVLYGLAERLGEDERLAVLRPYLPWLKENKMQAIAITAAVLYGLSLALLPEEKKEQDGFDGFQMVE